MKMKVWLPWTLLILTMISWVWDRSRADRYVITTNPIMRLDKRTGQVWLLDRGIGYDYTFRPLPLYTPPPPQKVSDNPFIKLAEETSGKD